MKCNRCGAELLRSNFCPECGSDVSFYKKAAAISNAYYNRGLEQARARELSAAIDSLKIAILLDKTNINARNLLGLCYYEIGEAVEGLGHWVVSKNLQNSANLANEYLEDIQKKKTDFDDKCVAVRKYNQVLESANNENYDVAMIQLKKIVANCPSFIKGQLLMALFYIEKRAYARAEKILNYILRVDSSNTSARRYLAAITNQVEPEKRDRKKVAFVKRDKVKTVEGERKPLSGNDVIIPNNTYKGDKNGAFSLLNILIGIGIGAAVIFFLVVPGIRSSQAATATGTEAELSSQLSSAQEELKTITSERDNLKTELSKAGSNNADSEKNNSDAVTKLITAADAYINKDYTSMAENIVAIGNSNALPDTAKKLYSTLSSKEYMNLAAESVWKKANAYYDAKDYNNAAQAFVVCYACDNESENSLLKAAISFGKIGNKDKAKEYYQMILDKFPNGENAATAKKYLESN